MEMTTTKTEAELDAAWNRMMFEPCPKCGVTLDDWTCENCGHDTRECPCSGCRKAAQ